MQGFAIASKEGSSVTAASFLSVISCYFRDSVLLFQFFSFIIFWYVFHFSIFGSYFNVSLSISEIKFYCFIFFYFGSYFSASVSVLLGSNVFRNW